MSLTPLLALLQPSLTPHDVMQSRASSTSTCARLSTYSRLPHTPIISRSAAPSFTDWLRYRVYACLHVPTITQNEPDCCQSHLSLLKPFPSRIVPGHPHPLNAEINVHGPAVPGVAPTSGSTNAMRLLWATRRIALQQNRQSPSSCANED